MTWPDLLHDLENEMAALEAGEADAEVADRTRGEVAATTLADRLAAHVGHEVQVATADEALRGHVRRVGADWVLVVGADGRAVVVATASIVSVRGLGPQALVPAATGSVAARTGLTVVLRRLVRDRSVVLVRLADGTTARGMLSRVAADHLDLRLVEGPADAPRPDRFGRDTAGRTVVVPLTAVRTVRQLEVD